LLAAYDDAWDAELNWESLGGILKNITEDEAQFQHSIYSDVPQEPGFPPNGTMLWHIAHLTHCYRWYKAAIEERPNAPKDFDPIVVTDLQDAIQNLKRYRDELRETIANVPEQALKEMLYYKQPVATLARSTVRHDAWHGGQIALAKRLYRNRELR
ncbi:MAG TPA: DinB family protein, partial [Candidatus Kapabacteria bacterium]